MPRAFTPIARRFLSNEKSGKEMNLKIQPTLLAWWQRLVVTG
jgi:hypothetical protein